MKLLVVMGAFPFPPKAGCTIIAYNNIRELSKHNSIHLLCRDVARDPEGLSQYVDQIEFVVPEKIPRFVQLCRYVYYMIQGVPSSITACKSREMERRVAMLIEHYEFDAILLYETTMIQYCPPSYYSKVIVNVEDPLSIKLSRLNRLPIWTFWKNVRLLLHARLMKRFEDKYFPRLAKVLLLSEVDKQDMRESGGYDNLGCVTYGVHAPCKEMIVRYEERTPGTIIYSGNMFHPPNVDGALFFLRKIFPLILIQYPAVTLWIVGAEPDRRIRSAAARFGAHVVITGRVDDLSKYLKKAIVSICPVRLRIGVQTKVLEALSWATPVVTTSAGNSGIGGLSGRDLWIADTVDVFASRVVALLRGEGWQGLSEQGRKLVETRFSWERSAEELEQHLADLQTAHI